MLERASTLRTIQGPAAGMAAQGLLLAVFAATGGVGAAGWVVGTACGLTLDLALASALWRDRSQRLGPAGWVTLLRATLAVGVAVLTAESLAGDMPVAPLVALASVALVLDYVDGWVARRTASESALGARMDGEVDAFLILVLSVAVAPSAGAWVLAIGAARYAFLAAGWAVAWMRAPLPRRDWRKTVAATQGIVLTVAAAGVVPQSPIRLALAGALALLAESFGRDVWWLWRNRRTSRPAAVARDRGAAAAVLTVLAVLIVWLALVAPEQPSRLTPGAFVRVPLEGIVVVALALVLPATARRILTWVAGPVLGVLVVVKLLDLGFFTAFDRPFNPVDDWSYTSIGIETLRDSVGRRDANLALAAVAVVGTAALALPTLAVRRLTRVAARHRRASFHALAGLSAAWVLFWALGAELVSGARVASTSAAALAVQEVQTVRDGLRDRAQFARTLRHDRYRFATGDRLLTGLRGKDVLLVFVESYGQVAVQGSSLAPGVDAVLDRGTDGLREAGFSSRSGWLTSPTFGGISWLAHSTLQAGVWVNSPTRYDQLVASDRLTLSQAFQRAGWRAVDDVPSNERDWAAGSSFYHYDKIYDRRNVGYRGPTYAYASMPDQYVWTALQRLELARQDRPPLFAEVDLVSSHEPWTQVPPLIAWNRVGDGSIFKSLPVDMTGARDARQGYGHSIEYTLRTLFSFVEQYGRKNLVLVVLGDHQPATTVSGDDPTHDVPISVIAHDPAVMRRIAGWDWVRGMRPSARAPIWPMNAFRDRFLSAFGSRLDPS
jgi:phosphatidylglycerophosphate synthase